MMHGTMNVKKISTMLHGVTKRRERSLSVTSLLSDFGKSLLFFLFSFWCDAKLRTLAPYLSLCPQATLMIFHEILV